MTFEIDDIVSFIDRGDFRATVSCIPNNHNGHIEVSFFDESGVGCKAYAQVNELVLIHRAVDTSELQFKALKSFAAILGYKFDEESNRFVNKFNIGSKYVSVNSMVAYYNKSDDSLKTIPRVKIQYSKKRKELTTQSKWIKF